MDIGLVLSPMEHTPVPVSDAAQIIREMLRYRDSAGAGPDEAAYQAAIRLLELDRNSAEEWLLQGLRSTLVDDGWQFVCAISYVCFYKGSLEPATVELLMGICADPVRKADARAYSGRSLCRVAKGLLQREESEEYRRRPNDVSQDTWKRLRALYEMIATERETVWDAALKGEARAALLLIEHTHGFRNMDHIQVCEAFRHQNASTQGRRIWKLRDGREVFLSPGFSHRGLERCITWHLSPFLDGVNRKDCMMWPPGTSVDQLITNIDGFIQYVDRQLQQGENRNQECALVLSEDGEIVDFAPLGGTGFQ